MDKRWLEMGHKKQARIQGNHPRISIFGSRCMTWDYLSKQIMDFVKKQFIGFMA